MLPAFSLLMSDDTRIRDYIPWSWRDCNARYMVRHVYLLNTALPLCFLSRMLCSQQYCLDWDPKAD